jgi:cell division septum initiation protein DivIVA
MAKALLGSHVAPSTVRLLDEVRALRQRVAELEAALAAAEADLADPASSAPDALAVAEVETVPAGEPEPATS